MVWFLEGGGGVGTESLFIASIFVMALSFSTIVFNPSVGWLGDKYSKQKLSSYCMIAGAVALVTILNHSGSLWQLFIFSILPGTVKAADAGPQAFNTLAGYLPGF